MSEIDPPRPTAAYLHVPFCAHHCGYCDFVVVAGRDHLIDSYLEALGQELRSLGEPHTVETIFIGGGTPTHPKPDQLRRLFDDIRRWLPLAEGGEWSVESNPDSLDAERVAVLASAGVTRVSIGVQSFRPDALAVLDRRHSADQIPGAIDRVRAAGLDFSLDLIFGSPGQTLDHWRADLDAALAFGPGHVSTYGLTYEKGTPLWKRLRRGEVRPLAEELELAMYEHAMDRLEAAGFEHYEISNFARPGRRCRHNETYWANRPYLGFGVGAARYVDGARELNTRSFDGYVRRVLAGESPTFQSERLGPHERALETVAVQLRRAEGVVRDEFRLRTDLDLDALIGPRLRDYGEMGLLDDDGRRIALTRRGKCVADAVIEGLMASASG